MSSISDRVEEKVCEDQLIKDESFVDEFVCKICLVHVVGCGPKLTKCSHLFCGDCLEQWFAQHPSNQTWAQRAKTGGSVPCPACKEPLRKDDVYPVAQNGSGNSSFLWSMIQSLKLRCHGQHGADCTGGKCCWQGTYGEYWEHLQGDICLEAESSETEAESEPMASMSTSPRSEKSSCCSLPSLAGLADFSTDESIPERHDDEVKTKVSQLDHGELEHQPVAEDLSSLIQSLVTLKMTQHTKTARPSMPPGLEDCVRNALSDTEDQHMPKAAEHANTTQPSMPPGVFKPPGLEVSLKSVIGDHADVKKMTPQKSLRNKAKTDRGAAGELHPARAHALAQTQAVYQQAAYQQAMQLQAVQAARWQQARLVYAGQIAQYQMAAQADHMQRLSQYQQTIASRR